jgi:tetratricopeptide (TPR) repeat protein
MKTAQLSRVRDDELGLWIKRLARLLLIGTIAFVAFYAFDRWRPATPAIVDQRVAALEQAVRENPNDLAIRGQLADAYVIKERFSDALAQYDAILAAGQELEPAHLGRAAALVGLNRLDEAAKDYQAVVDIAKGGEMANVDPTLEAAYYGLGSIAMKQDRPADAIPFLEKALAITRSDADALYLIGTAFVADGQGDKAITVLRAAVVFVPMGWSEPYVALSDAYTQSGQAALAAWAAAMADLTAGKPDLAEPALLALVDGEAALDASIGLGILYETRGDNAAAATWYEKAIQLEPNSNAALLGLSRVKAISTVGPSSAPTGPEGGNG